MFDVCIYIARLFEVEDENLAYLYAEQHIRKFVGDKVYQYDEAKEGSDDEEEAEVNVRDILKKWKLEQYADTLIDDQGYEDIEDWKSLTEDELINDIKMKKGHAKKFLRKIGEL